MDERTLFDRFHEALDIEPRPGAYERLRTQMTNQPVSLSRGPVFRMRFSKMAFRTAAALVAVLLALALIATFVAVHNRPVGEVPAHPDQNLMAYGAMIQRDYNVMNASTSNHCASIDDAGCAAALVPVKAALQKWVDDIANYPNTPAQLTAVAATLRAHLRDVIGDADADITFQKSGDAMHFNLAQEHAVYERAWVDPASFALEGVYQKVASSFQDAVARTKYSVEGCLGRTPGPTELACNRIVNSNACYLELEFTCQADVETVETQLQLFLIGMAQNPAPSSKAAGYGKVQADLTRADSAVLAVHDALLSGSSAAFQAASQNLLTALGDARADLATI